jgi:hypothetical protein
MKAGEEILKRYISVTHLRPEWEKVHSTLLASCVYIFIVCRFNSNFC